MIVTPEVSLIAKTAMILPALEAITERTGWAPEEGVCGAESLVEFAGRSCYESWDRPNAATATNADYIDNLQSVGHFSVLEHSSLTYYIRGVSRSLTHELVRHRHFAYSQLSQRYVDPGADASSTGNIIPPAFADDPVLVALFRQAAEVAEDLYADIIGALKDSKPDLTRKEYRQAARAVLPNMHETRIVVTGNFRALRHFFGMRCTEAADVEIRAVAIAMLRLAKVEAPSVFADYTIAAISDGTEIAYTPYSET